MAVQVRYGQAEQPLRGEDALLLAPELQLFGVFDGVGGRPAGGTASRIAAEAVRTFYGEPHNDEPNTIKSALEYAEMILQRSQRAAPTLGGMATTATIAKIHEKQGEPALAYAHIGDTRLYHLRDETLQQITVDEGTGNLLEQSLGMLRSVQQAGSFDLQSGDRLLLCSDGITDDWPPEELLENELLEALDPSHTPQTAAAILLEKRRKHDDASAIVVDIN